MFITSSDPKVQSRVTYLMSEAERAKINQDIPYIKQLRSEIFNIIAQESKAANNQIPIYLMALVEECDQKSLPETQDLFLCLVSASTLGSEFMETFCRGLGNLASQQMQYVVELSNKKEESAI